MTFYMLLPKTGPHALYQHTEENVAIMAKSWPDHVFFQSEENL